MTFDEDQESDLHELMLIAIEQTYRMTNAGVPLNDIKQTIIDGLVAITFSHELPLPQKPCGGGSES